jgi:isopentenyl diphosphate isomerase/L-lactate dehydrogenase-like FMN-dependent dehydrogenase
MAIHDQATSRRKFLQFLAASPFFAASDLAAFANEAPSRLPDPMVWAPHNLDKLIASPKDAINVFDFEPVARKNIPPAHFGYMASGIDDEVTLRENRAAFQKFQLRARRLVDVSKVDMSVELFGMKYDSPIIIAPIGSQKAYHPDGELAAARAGKVGNHLQMLSTQANTSIEDIIAARGAPIWYQLYATNKWEVAVHHVQRAEKAGALAVAVTVDSTGARNQETLFRMRTSDTRNCAECHDRSSLEATYKRRPMYDGADLSGLTTINANALTWESIKRLRDVTKMKILLKGILAWEDAKIAAAAGIDGIIVSTHGGRAGDNGRGTIDALPEIVEAAGSMPVLIDSGFRRGTDIVKALCIGAKGVAVGRPYIWGLGAFGQPGVERVLELLRTELRAAMQQVGAPTVKHLVPAMVKRV